MTLKVERRTILAGLVATVAAILLGRGRVPKAVRGAEPSSDALLPALAVLFSDPWGARAIGRRYLARYPAEADADLLKESLFSGLNDTGPAGLRVRLAERRRQEFAAGQTVILDGWILARSELRACALLTLLPRA